MPAEDAGRAFGLPGELRLCGQPGCGPPPILLELCLPFVKVGGMFVAMKGAEGKIEVEESGTRCPN